MQNFKTVLQPVVQVGNSLSGGNDIPTAVDWKMKDITVDACGQGAILMKN